MMMMMVVVMMMMMRCLSWLRFRAKPRHLPYIYIYIHIHIHIHIYIYILYVLLFVIFLRPVSLICCCHACLTQGISRITLLVGVSHLATLNNPQTAGWINIQVGLSEAGFFNCKFGVYPMFEQSQMKDPVKSPYLMVSSVRDMKIIYKCSNQLSKYHVIWINSDQKARSHQQPHLCSTAKLLP